MKIPMFSHFLFMCCVCLSFGGNLFAMDDESRIDPLIRMRYKDAFDQKDIHRQYAGLMRQFGCDINVFNDNIDRPISAMMSDYDPRGPSCASRCYNYSCQTCGCENCVLSCASRCSKSACHACSFAQDCVPCLWQDPNDHCDTITDVEHGAHGADHDIRGAYLKACHYKLQCARRWAIGRPIVEHGSFIGLMCCAGLAMHACLPPMGQAMGGAFVMTNIGYASREPIRALYQLAMKQKNDLEELEERFAANQCFIPKVLWPKIIDKFGMARTNKYEQQDCINFIKLALDLTVYAPKPPIAGSLDANNIKVELERRIRNFFTHYQINVTDECDQRNSINDIVIHVKKFVDALLADGPVVNPPKYLYLQGPPGIGKTHFIGQLKDWILELIPNSVDYEEIKNISKPEQLEGSQHTPGVMLNCLQKQLAAGKRGTVIVMDEATWLNEPGMVSACKRAFNGNHSKISTAYFGSGSEGQGTSIDVPPMLTCVASNESIKDGPLSNRFVIIHFPTPNKEKLVEYALAKARQCETFVKHPIDESILARIIDQWITDNKIDNFRRADDVETFLNSESAAKAIQELLHK